MFDPSKWGNEAMSPEASLPRLRYSVPCRRLVESHAESQAHRRQDLLDLVQRLAAEVLGLQHLAFGLLHELPDRPDIGVLEAVVRADRQLQLLDALVEVLVDRRTRRFAAAVERLIAGLVEADED